VIGIGRMLFAAGFLGLGVLGIGSGDFPFSWQPVPEGVPFREILARLSGVLLLSGGAGLLVRRTAAPAAFALAVYLLTWVVLLQGARVAHAPADVGAWLGVAESLVLTCGGWQLFARLTAREPRPRLPVISGPGGVRTARLLWGASCLVLGLSHYVYTQGTAGMIPAWIPAHVFFAYLTGTAHLAAGAGVLLAILPRLAATLESVMITLFVLLLHLPGVAAAPSSRLQWTMVFVATALAGASWCTAASFDPDRGRGTGAGAGAA
jgi:uncharacterized membrane protein